MDWYEDALESQKKRRRARPLREKIRDGLKGLKDLLLFILFAFVVYCFIFGPLVGPKAP